MSGRRPVRGVDELSSLEQAIAALEGQRGVLGDQVVDIALRPLADKRNRLLAAAAGEQRKLVSVLFGDLVDFTGLSQRLDAEDVRHIMNRYFAAWRSAIEAEGGVLEKFIGDAVMAVFGLHRAREDDPHRAVRAALAMRGALADLSADIEGDHGLAMQMRVGIDTGDVVVSILDDRAGEDFVVVGDTVNRAARLQESAPPGGILLSADTCRHVRGSFGLARLEALRLKGIRQPLDAYLVVSGTVQGFWPEARGVEGISTRTVGRQVELERLQKLYTDVVDDRCWRLVTVFGEAGIGKSRLVHDLEDWFAGLPEGVWALRGRASPSTDVANALLRSVFVERLSISETDEPAVVRTKWHGLVDLLGGGTEGTRSAEVVATWLGFSLGDDAELTALRADPPVLRRRAGALVIRILGALAATAPVVVLLEDLHWADSASLDWLEEIAGTSGSHPMLVVVTARPSLLELRPSWGEELGVHTSIRLEPLSQEESRALLMEILQRVDDVPEALVGRVVSVADGNPYYVEELVKWLVDEGVIRVGSGRWSVVDEAMRDAAVPSTLRGVLQARLDSLGRAERSLIDRASVVGRVFWDGAVASLASPGASAAGTGAFEVLAEREVVFERPRSAFEDTREFSFRHALLRDVAYEGVLRATRRKYHGLAARWLEDVLQRSQRPDEHAAEVAHHHEAAGDAGAAATWYLRAGKYAAGTFAGNDALRLLARAEELAPSSETALRCDVLLAREGVLDRLGRRPEQRFVLDELTAMPDLDDARRAEVRLAEGRWRFVHGKYGSAPVIAEEAANLARAARRPDLELLALVLGGRTLTFASEHDEATRLLELALDRARVLGDHRQAGESLRLLAVVSNNLGHSLRALDLLAAARAEHREIADIEGEALVAGQLGAVLIVLGRLDEARAASQEALDLFVATGHRLRQGIVLGNLATVAIDQGRLDDAGRHSADTLRLTEEIDDPEGIVSSLGRLGDVHRLTGDYSAARGHLERGIEKGRLQELHYFTANALCSLVALDLAEGHVDQAVAHADEARDAARLADIPHTQSRAVFAAGLARREAGEVAAVPLLREAAALSESLGMGTDLAECRAILAVALVTAGDLDEAVGLAGEVLAALDDGALPGALDPGRVLIDCHRVLEAAGDPRAADVSRRAAEFLRERSSRIRDDRLRSGFLCTPVSVELGRIAVLTDPGRRS